MNMRESDLHDQASMVEAAARALSFTPWHLAPEGLKRIIRRQAERVLTAALAGRTVVELPETDDTVTGLPERATHDDEYLPEDQLSERARSMCRRIRALVDQGDPTVSSMSEAPGGDRDRAFAFGVQRVDGQRFRITVEPST